MFEYDESIEREEVIRVVGVGEFGLKAVGKMVDRIHMVKSLGVAPKGNVGPNDLPLVPFPWNADEKYQDLAPFLKMNGADLVFIVADPADDEDVLKEICGTFFENEIRAFLVLPESAYKSRISSGSFKLNEGAKVTLFGVIVISESSMEPPFPGSLNGYDSQMLQDYFCQLAIRQITELITTSCLIGIDFHDVMHRICGGVMRFGAGIAFGDGKAANASEKAISCLIKQGIELQNVPRALCSIYASRGKMTMDDYNSAAKFIYDQSDEKSDVLVGAIFDDSLVDQFMVGIIAMHEPALDAVFPQWVRLLNWPWPEI